MAPTTTTGTGTLTARSRKYAVSSSVAVPCVTTMPAIEGSPATVSSMIRSSASQSDGPISVLPTFLYRIGTISATRDSSGTPAISSSTCMNRPDVPYS